MDFSNTPALRQVFVLEATWTDCPQPVVDEIREIWSHMEFGNDNYYYHFQISDEPLPEKPEGWTDEDWNDLYEDDSTRYPVVAAYLREHNISSCLIHFWW